MKIIFEKENFLNAVKAVRGIVNARGVQPILASILMETGGEDKIKLITTDLNLSISYTTDVKVEEEGKIAISARVIEEIITKIPDDKEIKIEYSKETNLIKIQSGKIKYEVIGLNAEEFPNIFNNTRKTIDDEIEPKEFEIDAKELNLAIKQTAFSAVQNEVGGVLTGICFTISENTLEMAATDGNRLTRTKIPINAHGENISFICAYKTLIEISKLLSAVSDEKIKFVIKGTKILFEFKNIIFQSGLIDGTYPKYQQLIPSTNEKTAIISREDFINTIDRVSVMVSARTNIIKFNFEENSLEISTDTPDSGSAKERMDIEYTSENLLIAFNYKYVLDVVRNITTPKIKIEMSTNLSAAVVKTDKETDDYLCLIMPVQVR